MMNKIHPDTEQANAYTGQYVHRTYIQSTDEMGIGKVKYHQNEEGKYTLQLVVRLLLYFL